jgi:hypothetical protein
MPFLVINTVTIPVDLEEVTTDVWENGDRGRAADGTYLHRLGTLKLDTPIKTRWIPEGDDFDDVYEALTAAPPLPATGDLVGAGYYVDIEVLRTATHSFAGGLHKRIEFIVHEI